MTGEARTTASAVRKRSADTTKRDQPQFVPVLNGGEWREGVNPPNSSPGQARPQPVEGLGRHEVRAVVAADGTRYCVFCLKCVAEAGVKSSRHMCDACDRPRKTHIQRLARQARRQTSIESGGESVPGAAAPGSARRARSIESEAPNRVISMKRANGSKLPVIVMTLEEAENLLGALDALQDAIGRGSSHFRRSERGGWQHGLLLASKDMFVEMEKIQSRLVTARDRRDGESAAR